MNEFSLSLLFSFLNFLNLFLLQLLHSAEQSEFTVVTIPTEVAAAETRRLLAALEEENIAVRRVIINQIIPTPSADSNGMLHYYIHDFYEMWSL
jgi:anion-transporting  ArsA/GET3 family ATPase